MKQETVQARQQAILVEIIQYYLSRHEAISARTLSKISQLALSPTTIRNLMEDLSLDGYLTTEGVSRGRIPTQKAFTIYVSRLGVHQRQSRDLAVPINLGDEEQLPTLDAVMAQMGRFLSEQTGFIALASLPEKDSYPLDWVRLVPIGEDRLLVAVQSLYGDLWSKVVPAAEPLPPDVLKEVEWSICRNYHGQPMRVIREDIMSGMPKDLLANAPSIGAAFRLLRKVFDWDKAPGWQAWGMEKLYMIPEYQQPEKIVRVHRALQDPNLLSRVLQNARSVEGGLVSIGTETGYPGLEESSVVGFVFGDGAEWQGMIALMGPMRMDYPLIFNLVSQAAKALGGNLREFRENSANLCV
ncbi:MAG: hypothetical protein O6934_08055 [SAR324 cluster bacterium]|nr:hypothetical protein [SAR324 cluster bacterium]